MYRLIGALFPGTTAGVDEAELMLSCLCSTFGRIKLGSVQKSRANSGGRPCASSRSAQESWLPSFFLRSLVGNSRTTAASRLVRRMRDEGRVGDSPGGMIGMAGRWWIPKRKPETITTVRRPVPLNDALSIPKRIKVWSNRICDRIIEHSGGILLDYALIRPGWLRNAAHWGARTAARVCALWRDLPQMPVYDLAGTIWRLRVVGDASQAAHVAHVFFPGEEPEFAESAAWRAIECRRWCRNGWRAAWIWCCARSRFPAFGGEMYRSILSCPTRWSNIWCSIRPWSKW